MNYNIYIHFPYCISKCKYCCFYSIPSIKPNFEEFEKSVIKEIKYWYEKLGKIKIETIFFGGGTPSLMSENTFENILTNISNYFEIDPNIEITIEANPCTLSFEKLKNFKEIGINRLSVGMQSFNDNELKFMGRIHTSKEAIDLIESAKNLDLNVSADFIYGLPNQTTADIKEMCKNINALKIKHCSLYELSIEENTPFYNMNLKRPNDEVLRDMYLTINDNLDLPRYEVSNYAYKEFECRHNKNIWQGFPYIGLGKGASGRILIKNNWYEQRGNFELFEKISDKDRNIEKIITGLRTKKGIYIPNLKEIINFNFIDKNKNLFIFDGDNLSLNINGILILDTILVNIIK